MLYLIHQAGKMASQTLEATIRLSDPSAKIERHHFLLPENLADIDAICDASGSAEHIEQQRYQTRVARAALAALKGEDPDRVWVVTGVRDPLDHVISKFFQNISEYYPSYTSPAAGEVYDPARFDVQVDATIDVFKRQVGSYFEIRRAAGGKSLPLATFWPVRYAWHLSEWFEREFKPLHDVDVCDIQIGTEPFVHVRAERRHFVLYRMETFRDALPSLLKQLPLPGAIHLSNQNVSAEKDYAVLYRRFRERFEPTDEMVEYYYGGRFFDHFYGNTAPLYKKGRLVSEANR